VRADRRSANAVTMAATVLVGLTYPYCATCERLVPELYGGPGDRSNDGTDPCESCVMESFADHG
jgi:hypothetical protein